MFMNYCLNIF